MNARDPFSGGLLDRLARLWPFGRKVAGPPPEAKIETPEEDSLVPFRISVEGTHRNIPDNNELWLIVYEAEADLFYPQPSAIMLLPGGRWYTMAAMGEDKREFIGRKFEIILLMLPRAVAMSLVKQAQEAVARGKTLGTPDIPRNGVVMDRRIVTRW